MDGAIQKTMRNFHENKKKSTMKNPMAKKLSDGSLKQRVVKPKKGKGSYDRNKRK